MVPLDPALKGEACGALAGQEGTEEFSFNEHKENGQVDGRGPFIVQGSGGDGEEKNTS